MSTPVKRRSMHELCADNRTLPLPDGTHLNDDAKLGLGAEEYLNSVPNGERMPQIGVVIHRPETAGLPLTAGFRTRLPAESYDKTAVRPKDPLALNLAELGALAEAVGHFVQVPKGALTLPAPTAQLPGQQDRLTPLDARGFTTTWDQASYVRVQPTQSRTGGAWSDLSAGEAAQLGELFAGHSYLGGRIVFDLDSVQIGLPPGLVDAWHEATAAGFGRPLNNDDIATARAGGAGPSSALPGYVELLRRMEQSPANSQALVKVDDAADGSHVFLAHHDGFNVMFLDLGHGPATARFPKEHGDVELTMLPDTMSLDERIDSMMAAGRPQPAQLVRPIMLPIEVQNYRPDNGPDVSIAVVGSRDGVPTSFLDELAKHAPMIDQPIIVLSGIGRDGRVPPKLIGALKSRLAQEGLHKQVPVVLTRAGLKGGAPETAALHRVLDEARSSLVYQVPSGLGSSWTVREAKDDAAQGQAAQGSSVQVGAAAGKRLFDQLDLPLLQLAAGENRQPRQTPPPKPVADFLTTPLREQIGSKSLQDLFGSGAKTLAPLVQQIALQDPIFAGNSAALQLAAMDQAGSVTKFASNPGKGWDALFEPVLRVPGATPSERQQGIQTLLPLLADLAGGHGITDNASQGVLLAFSAKLAGNADDQQMRDMIWDRKDSLSPEAKVSLVRLMGEAKKQLPESAGASADKIGEWILTCPD